MNKIIFKKIISGILTGIILASVTAAASGLVRTYKNETKIDNIYMFLSDIKASIIRLEAKIDEMNKGMKND